VTFHYILITIMIFENPASPKTIRCYAGWLQVRFKGIGLKQKILI